jgi:hypothetical protein
VVLDDNIASTPRPRGDESPRYWTAPHQWGLQAYFSLIDRALFASPAIYRGTVCANHSIR